MLFRLLQLSRAVTRCTVCVARGHRWSTFGDEDEQGWFWDRHGHCYTRSCVRCDHTQHRDPPMKGRFIPRSRWGL